MNSLLPQHKLLASIAGAALALYFLGQFFVCRPAAVHVAELEENVTVKRKNLLRQGWPLDHALLQQTHADKTKETETLETRNTEVFDRVTAAFEERIVSSHETRHNFQTQVSRLYFQEEFSRIETKFSKQNVVFAQKILNLHEDMAWPYIYQLVLQLWTLEATLDQVLQHDLRPVMVPVTDPRTSRSEPSGAKQPRASAVSVLPPIAYISKAKSSEPYLLEFAVQLTVKGDLNNLLLFFEETQTGQPFIAIDNIQIRTFPPDNQDGLQNEVYVDLQCSTFFPLTSE